MPNQAIAEKLGVPKVERMREYERPQGEEPVPFSLVAPTLRNADIPGNFVRGARGLAGAAGSAADAMLHPYGKEGEDDRRLRTAKARGDAARAARDNK